MIAGLGEIVHRTGSHKIMTVGQGEMGVLPKLLLYFGTI